MTENHLSQPAVLKPFRIESSGPAWLFPAVPADNPASGPNNQNDLLLEHRQGTETVLFVEDEEALRHVVSDLLAALGYKVLIASGGAEALEIAAQHGGKIDLLLTDVMLGRINGPALAEQLLSSRPGMKVIYVSGYDDGILAPQGVLEPGIVLLHKPFTIKVLSNKLREVLDE